MTRTELVSTVIPVYNSVRYLPEAIESALHQTWANMEIIVVDDGSTDETVHVLRKYEANPRVRVFRQENAGPAAARNRALRESRGSYLAFLDSDDLWEPQKTEKQLAFLREHQEIGLVYSTTTFLELEPDGRWVHVPQPAHSKGFYRRGRIFKEVVESPFIVLSSAIIPRHVIEAVGPFDQELMTAEDRDLFARIAHDYPIDFVDEPLVMKREHGANLSSSEVVTPRTLVFLRKLGERYPECSLRKSRWMRRVYIRHAQALAYDDLYCGLARRARGWYWKACRVRPFSLTSWVGLAAALLLQAFPGLGRVGHALSILLPKRHRS